MLSVTIAMAVFTGGLLVTSVLQWKRTGELLSHNERVLNLNRDSLHLGRDSLEQTRRAFLVNLVNETTYYGTQLMVTKPVPDWLTAYLRAIHGAIKDVDAESAKRFEEAWRRWSGSEWSTIREMGPQILKAFETTRENPR